MEYMVGSVCEQFTTVALPTGATYSRLSFNEVDADTFLHPRFTEVVPTVRICIRAKGATLRAHVGTCTGLGVPSSYPRDSQDSNHIAMSGHRVNISHPLQLLALTRALEESRTARMLIFTKSCSNNTNEGKRACAKTPWHDLTKD